MFTFTLVPTEVAGQPKQSYPPLRSSLQALEWNLRYGDGVASTPGVFSHQLVEIHVFWLIDF